MSKTQLYKVLRPLKNITIGGGPHEIWQIVRGDIGIAVVILPDEDSTRKTRKERIGTARKIVQALNEQAGIAACR